MTRGKNTRIGVPNQGDLAMTPGGALELPRDAEPWTMDASMRKAKLVKVTTEVARRCQYLGWMTWIRHGKDAAAGAVFQDLVTARRFVQYVP